MVNKYRNKKVILDGIEFDSRKEANRWWELKMMERAGEIQALQRQVKYVLIPAQYDMTGGKKGKCLERECAYYADFVYVDNRTMNLVVEDTKGLKTDTYVIKRKLMLEKFGIRIKEI